MDQQLTSLEIGRKYLFFTVTYFYVGEVVAITPTDVRLANCSLVYGIPSLGKFFDAKNEKDLGACCEEIGFLGEFILHGFTGARPIAALPRAEKR